MTPPIQTILMLYRPKCSVILLVNALFKKINKNNEQKANLKPNQKIDEIYKQIFEVKPKWGDCEDDIRSICFAQ